MLLRSSMSHGSAVHRVMSRLISLHVLIRIIISNSAHSALLLYLAVSGEHLWWLIADSSDIDSFSNFATNIAFLPVELDG